MNDPQIRRAAIAAIGVATAAIFLWLTSYAPPASPPRPVAAVEISPTPLPSRLRVELIQQPTAIKVPGIELCGRGIASISAHDPLATNRYLKQLTGPTWNRWLSHLRDSSDFRARAAALVMENIAADTGTEDEMDQATLEDLKQLVAGARDPAAYALAVHACRKDYGDRELGGACQEVTLDAWGAMDPDNAVPWLLIAERAHEKQDAQAEADALRHASEAHTVESYRPSLQTFSEPQMPKDVTPLEHWFFSSELQSVESGNAAMESQAASNRCSDETIQDPVVRQECTALAELFVSRGKTLQNFAMGATLGARVGWSAARVAKLSDERTALVQATVQAMTPDNGQFWGCDAVQRGNEFVSEETELGELGAARNMLERSGKTVPELVQQQRDTLTKLRGANTAGTAVN